MIELANFVVGSIFGLIVGIIVTLVGLNHTHDAQTRVGVVKMIDDVVVLFHQKYGYPGANRKHAEPMLDYQMMSLFGDTKLIPILGRKMFEGDFTASLGELFELSQLKATGITAAQSRAHISKVNSVGAKLKRMADARSGSFRLFARK